MSIRICAAPGCETILSVYNTDELCAPCAPHFVPGPNIDPRRIRPELEPRPRPKRKRTRIDPAVGDKRKLRDVRPPLTPLTDETAPPVLGELCNTIEQILKGMLAE